MITQPSESDSRNSSRSESKTHRVTFADLEVLPERLTTHKVKVSERDTDLTDRIIAAESVVVKNLKVEGSSQQFVVGKP